jgi:signal transduction histidine kinase/FixJ family two-component response regulator
MGSSSFDVVLMDVGLPGMSGVDAAAQIRERWAEVQVILITDWGRAELHNDKIEWLRSGGVSLLLKPFLPEELLSALLDAQEPAEVTRSAHMIQESSSRTSGPIASGADRRALSGLLVRLKNATHANKVVMFELSTASMQSKITEECGRIPLDEGAIPGLIHSPVRDAAEDKQRVLARNTSDVASDAFKHLTPLLDFGACLGVPVPAAVPNRYALFVFYTQSGSINDIVEEHVTATAVAAGAWLERRQVMIDAGQLQRVALLGQLAGFAVHEVSNGLNRMNPTLEELQEKCRIAEKQASQSADLVAVEMRLARDKLNQLVNQARALTQIVRRFGRMTRPGKEEFLLMDEVIDAAVSIVQDAATQAGVTIAVRTLSRLSHTRTQVTYLLQVLINLLLNAIQQIEQAPGRRGGRVELCLQELNLGGKQVVRVTIEDDGPGIHRRLWDRIFELGFTTRDEGSGLGLYISRSLIEDQGGRLFVSDSRVLWGTSITVELPVLP